MKGRSCDGAKLVLGLLHGPTGIATYAERIFASESCRVGHGVDAIGAFSAPASHRRQGSRLMSKRVRRGGG
eukprot:scaffold100935_cov29-Tisochrysis_lutea.AAC.1